MRWKPSEDQIKKKLIELTRQKNELETRKFNLDQALSSHQACDIFTTSASIDKMLPSKPAIQADLSRSKFIPEDISKCLSKTFGYIYNIPEIDLVNTGTYPTELSSIRNLLLNDNNPAYIYGKLDENCKKFSVKITKPK